ncbi:MAG TPA: hypothetical protein VMJ10_18720 [Kofleriaceae bacterium]|nr:hypothetical protein [Kofleriaceae bacterium]
MSRYLVLCAVVACGGSSTGTAFDAPPADTRQAVDGPPQCADAAPPTSAIDCTTQSCSPLSITNDPPSTNSGTFAGLLDPSVAHDPAVSGQLWLAYSWAHTVAGTDLQNNPIEMGVIETHLAASSNSGASFGDPAVLWPAVPTLDPEGSGQMGMMNSETPSIATITSGSTTTWYGAHLVYFQQAEQGYNPKYGTSWTIHVAAASSPAALGSAAATVLGVSTTAAVYAPNARLDVLAELPITQCSVLNNPTLFTQDGTLYLIVECIAVTGSDGIDAAHSTIQVFATTPSGAPTSWTWRHAGVLADHSLAIQLDADTIQQPDVSLARDGTPILIVSPATLDAGPGGAAVPLGCAVFDIASIDPPMLARDCADRFVMRSELTGSGWGLCTHDAAMTGGIITAKAPLSWSLATSGLQP